MNSPRLRASVGLLSAIVLVVSGIIGSGVFKKIADMSATLGSPLGVLACWTLAGGISLAGALSNAEIASSLADSGGDYAYFKKIYGRFFAFLYGWANFVVVRTATTAALSVIFAQSFFSIFPFVDSVSHTIQINLLATAAIVFLSWGNARGVAFGERLSQVLTLALLMAIISFLIAIFFSEKGSLQNLHQSILAVPKSGYDWLKALFVASLGAFWSYEGWNNIGNIGEEIKNPERNLPKALFYGTLVVVVLYILLNGAYLYLMPIAQLASFDNQIAAVEVARLLGGGFGAVAISTLILVSTLNCTHAGIMLPARIFYAMARDGLFFKNVQQVHPRYHTPVVSIVYQGLWSVALVWLGTFDQLTDMMVFTSFIFYGSMAAGVLVLRRHQPLLTPLYQVPTILPILFVLFSIGLICFTLMSRPQEALMGLALVMLGIPFYWYWNKNTLGRREE
jgi:basic amino acid/polyamine antiporter, APA family